MGKAQLRDVVASRRVRADAQQSTIRILEAAKTVLTADPNASLEQVAEEAGLARATVHRRFSSRQSLLDALAQDLNGRYRQAFEQSRVRTAAPLVALHRLTEIALELQVNHPFVINLHPTAHCSDAPASDPAIQEGLDILFTRLHAAGDITATDLTWCRRIYLALLHEVHELPPGSPALSMTADDIGARVELLVKALIGALGGHSKNI